jgi:hypothetical protein
MPAVRTTLVALTLLVALAAGRAVAAEPEKPACCTIEPLPYPGGALVRNTCEQCKLCTVEWNDPGGAWRETLALPKGVRETRSKASPPVGQPRVVGEEDCRSGR